MSVRIIATGDIVLTRADADCRPDPRVQALKQFLSSADVVVSSVELPFSDVGHPSDRVLNFRARPELVTELVPYGLTVATLANNHSSDYGWEALDDTRQRIESLGIRAIGAGENRDEAERPAVLEAGGKRIGIIPRTCLIPLGAAAGPQRPGVASVHIDTAWEVNGEYQLEEPGVPPRIRTTPRAEDRERLLTDVRELAADVDLVIVSVHWGWGFGTDMAEYQRPLAHALVDAGAGAVLGHHAHAPQGVELYRGAPIVYSPGNFIAQQPRDPDHATPEILAIYDAFVRDAYVSVVDVADNGSVSLQVVPIETEPDGRPALLDAADAAAVARNVRSESRRRFGTDLVEIGGEFVARPLES
ncbi:CapA family protein [Microbacterium kunmingense]|uniref:CapA family protein n=1 Tax=Microbacterium kunmingense TaxID=2915939 RepID=UPI002006168D|nr:CapA family protein [Microbacterium kunmingense]